MAKQPANPAPEPPPSHARLLAWDAWISLIAAIACISAYGYWPLHPKSGTTDVIAMIGFSAAAALGIGMSLVGMRSRGAPAKAAACGALALFAIVALDLAKILMNV